LEFWGDVSNITTAAVRCPAFWKGKVQVKRQPKTILDIGHKNTNLTVLNITHISAKLAANTNGVISGLWISTLIND